MWVWGYGWDVQLDQSPHVSSYRGPESKATWIIDLGIPWIARMEDTSDSGYLRCSGRNRPRIC